MSDKQKDYWRQMVGQKLRGLDGKGIAKSIDGQNFKIDLDKYAQDRANIIKMQKRAMYWK